MKDNLRVAFHNLPKEVGADLKESLSGCTVSLRPTSTLDFVVLFTKGRDDLLKQLPIHAKQLAPAGMLWVSWPKKSSGIACDMNENDIRAIGLAARGRRRRARDVTRAEGDRLRVARACRAAPGCLRLAGLVIARTGDDPAAHLM